MNKLAKAFQGGFKKEAQGLMMPKEYRESPLAPFYRLMRGDSFEYPPVNIEEKAKDKNQTIKE